MLIIMEMSPLPLAERANETFDIIIKYVYLNGLFKQHILNVKKSESEPNHRTKTGRLGVSPEKDSTLLHLQLQLFIHV